MAKVTEVKIKSNKKEVLEAAEIDILAWLAAVGEDASDVAASKAPVDTGELKNSISYATPVEWGHGSSIPQAIPESGTVYIGTNVDYGIWHEFGTGKYNPSGRKTPWAFKDKKTGEWHYTAGVPAKHFIKFGMTAHKNEYKKALEMHLKGQGGAV